MKNFQLTVADMASLKGIIEAACARGTFRANELSTVGEVYDKLTYFVQQSAAQVQSAASQTSGDPNA